MMTVSKVSAYLLLSCTRWCISTSSSRLTSARLIGSDIIWMCNVSDYICSDVTGVSRLDYNAKKCRKLTRQLDSTRDNVRSDKSTQHCWVEIFIIAMYNQLKGGRYSDQFTRKNNRDYNCNLAQLSITLGSSCTSVAAFNTHWKSSADDEIKSTNHKLADQIKSTENIKQCAPPKKNQKRDKQAVRVETRYAPAPLLPAGAPAPRAPPSRRNVAVVSHTQYILTVTAAPASRVKAWWPWPWPWKWCPRHVWRGLPLCQFWSS